MYEMKKWHMIKPGKRALIWGYVVGNPNFSNGSLVHTSRIAETQADLQKECLVCITKSGSQYCLDFDELDMEYWRETKTAMGYLKVSPDVFDMCVSKSKGKEKELVGNLSKKLEAGDLYVRLMGVNAIYAYFKDDSLIRMQISCNVGMHQDSILIRDTESGRADFRYYPFDFPQVGSIEPYHASSGIKRLIVSNDGEEITFKGSDGVIQLKPGVEAVIERSSLEQEGLLSPDCTGEAPLMQSMINFLLDAADDDN